MSTAEMSLNDVPPCSGYPIYPDGQWTDFCKFCENLDPEFCERLTKYFRSYVETAGPGNELDFIRELRSVKEFEPYLRHEKLKESYIEFKFSIFEKFRTTNSDMIKAELVDLMIHKFGYFVLPEFPPYDEIQFPSLEEMSHFLDRRRVENSNIYYIDMDRIVLQDFTAMQRLVRYGIRFKLNYDHRIEHIRSYAYNFRVRETRDEEEMVIIDRDRIYDLIDRNYTTDYSKRRMLFLSHVIEFRLIKNECDYKSCIKSFDLIFKTIPDPLIRANEISRFLKIVLQGEDKDNFIKDVCEDFAEEFPESKEPLHPRSLKHLSRCTIRNCLRENKKLPHGVWSLGLPKRLRNYVLLQRDESEFYPKFLSELST